METHPQSFRRTKIVINADDGFYSDIRDQGIVSCLSGINSGVSDVSVLMNGAVARHLLSVLDYQRKQLSALFSYLMKNNLIPGLHFNLTEGKPLKYKRSVQSLLDHRDCFLGKYGFREHLLSSAVDMNEVELELESQLQAFKQLFGTVPSHLDGHQHIHVLPGIDAVVARVLSRNGVKWIRVPVERIPEVSPHLTETEAEFYKNVSDQATKAREIFSSYGLKYTQGFIKMAIMGKRQSIDSLDRCLSPLKNCESIEFMVHPGFKVSCTDNDVGHNTSGCGNPEGPDLFSQSDDREHEMNFLLGDEFQKYMLQHNYDLITFSNLS
uniref:Carbohydrate deacetylase n=1 Tax=Trichobilharzia regenti TaxID=157069 RepID=A0AA85JNH1_TRIRE|nr:unnamed protein product [Trichobilharzia regenti]